MTNMLGGISRSKIKFYLIDLDLVLYLILMACSGRPRIRQMWAGGQPLRLVGLPNSLANFPCKMHENKEYWAGGGGHIPGDPTWIHHWSGKDKVQLCTSKTQQLTEEVRYPVADPGFPREVWAKPQGGDAKCFA